MSKSETVHIRMYTNNSQHAYALDCLKKLSSIRSCSINQIIADALIFYYREIEGIRRLQDEERLIFEKSICHIVDGVREELSKTIPAFIAGCCVSGGAAANTVDTDREKAAEPQSVVSDEFSEDDIAWGYLGD